MSGDIGLTILPSEEIDQAPREEIEVTLQFSGPTSVAVGKFLDRIDEAARLGGLECEITAPGYALVFYGWEKKRP